MWKAALAAFATVLFTASVSAQLIVLDHATVIDGTGAQPQKDIAIVIDGGRIRDMGPSARLGNVPGATVVDLTGKFIVPGIINAHGHVGANPEPQLRQYALYGVTTTTSMATDPDELIRLRDEQRRGTLRGARVLTVKHRFMGPDPAIPTPQLGRAKVDEIVAGGADFVKVWIDSQGGKREKLARDFCAAVMDQARKHGKITMAHVYELVDAQMIVDEGVNVLAHNVRDQEMDDTFVRKLKERNVSVISTLAREEAMFVFADAPGFIDDPFFRKGLSSERLAMLKTQKREEQASDPERERNRRSFEIDKINLRKLSDAGVRIAFGTDSGGAPERFFIQGFFEHRQMELMVEAGLTPIKSFSRSRKALPKRWGSKRNSARWRGTRPPISSCWIAIRSTTS